MNKVERIKMVKAMEFICRQVNNEEVFEEWLIDGVADGDIEYGNLSVEVGDFDDWSVSYYTEDEHFKDLMKTFLNVMKNARKDGGLYCDNVVC